MSYNCRLSGLLKTSFAEQRELVLRDLVRARLHSLLESVLLPLHRLDSYLRRSVKGRMRFANYLDGILATAPGMLCETTMSIRIIEREFEKPHTS